MTSHGMRRPFLPILFAVGGVVLAGVLALLFGLIVLVLWNWLMPAIFGLGTITYWQAWGLVLLAHILFKTVGRPHRTHEAEEHWKERFRERFRDRFERGEAAGSRPVRPEGPGPEGHTPSEGGPPEGGRPGGGTGRPQEA
jgi:hypothetical protein